jgi:dTDP-4-dehydrorhamnose reductase
MQTVDFLVIGANGLVGRRVLSLLKAKGESASGTYNRRAEGGLIPFDITDGASARRIFKDLAPRRVYLCANLPGGVDYCEKNPAQARRFYYDATVNIGNLCGESGASLIFISTDYVFDGSKGPYMEEDGKNPLNLYGRLKLEAEEWIRKNMKKHIIARTTNVFGWDPQTVTPNYVMNLYMTLRSSKLFNAPSYLWGNPTYAGDLAAALIELSDCNASGIFHVVGGSFVNRYEWAIEACRALELDAGLIKEVKDPPQNAVPRPLKSWLGTDKFRGSFKTVLHSMKEGLALMKEESDKDDGR